jgi:hypothetical protein
MKVIFTAPLVVLIGVAAMSWPARLGAQAQARPLTTEGFQKLKQKALEEKKTITIPPEAKKALRLADTASAVECKQLVAGDLAKKYYFIVATAKDTDDVFVSVQTANGDVRMFLTNSKLELRNAVTGARGKNLSAVTNVQAVEEEFNGVLAVWAQIAAGL